MIAIVVRSGANVNIQDDPNATPLHAAVINGELDVVKTLISNGADVNAPTKEGFMPLHYAAQIGHNEIANLLLKHGADANAYALNLDTPLSLAATNGRENIVTMLLKKGADVKSKNCQERTPLHLAAGNGNLNIVANLLKHKADVKAADKNKSTALHLACEGGHKEVARLLIDKNSNINAKNSMEQNVIQRAALKGKKEIVQLLIDHGANVNNRDNDNHTPLHSAVYHGFKDVVNLLLKNKANINAVNKFGLTPIYLATTMGHYDIVELLIKRKANANIFEPKLGTAPLHVAITKEFKDIVTLLIKNKVNINGGKSLPLSLAIERGNKDIVSILIENGAKIDSKEVRLPMLIAIDNGSKEIVEILINNGVKADDKMFLFRAIVAGCNDVLEILLKNKASIRNVRFKDKKTPLHLAAGHGYLDIVNTLIKWKADVNAVDVEGKTPSKYAIENGYRDIAKILLQRMKNTNRGNELACTPLHLEATNDHFGAVKLLLSKREGINACGEGGGTPFEFGVMDGCLNIMETLFGHSRMNLIEDDVVKDRAISRTGNGFGGDNEVDLLSLNGPGAFGGILRNGPQILKYLKSHGMNVNAKVDDESTCTNMHIEVDNGKGKVIEVLLCNDAAYDPTNGRQTTLSESMRKGFNLSPTTLNLFGAVKQNNPSNTLKYIEEGASINAKDKEGYTVLHYAAKKGFDKVVKVLLENKVNPNLTDNKGLTPLHHAAKISNFKIMKNLLFHGAIYNPISKAKETPSNLTRNDEMKRLFHLINKSFEKVEKNDGSVIDDLNKIKQVDLVKTVLRARDTDNRTLLVVAMQSEFSKKDLMKNIGQRDISKYIDTGYVLFARGNYREATKAFSKALEIRKEILGMDNPATLEIEAFIGKSWYKEGTLTNSSIALENALDHLNRAFEKQKEILGSDHKDTLNTQSTIAFVFHRTKKWDEALAVYQEVYRKQRETLGSGNSDTLNTHFHQALLLNEMGKYDEALVISKSVYEKRKMALGENDLITMSALNCVAMVLTNQGRYDESFVACKQVFETLNNILTIRHVETIKTLHRMAGIFSGLLRHIESLNVLKVALELQREVCPENEIEIFVTQCNIANVLYDTGLWDKAYEAYVEAYEEGITRLQFEHPYISHCSERMQIINDLLSDKYLEQIGSAESKQKISPTEDQKDFSKKCEKFLKDFLQRFNSETEVTITGSTALHIAVQFGCLNSVIYSLKNGAIFNARDIASLRAIDYSTQQEITNLLELIEELFEGVENGDEKVLVKLNAVNAEEFEAITRTKNEKNRTLLKCAIIRKRNIAKKLAEMMRNKSKNCN